MRLALFAPALLLVGCASARTSALVASDSSGAFIGLAPKAEITPPPSSAPATRIEDRSEPVAALEAEAPLTLDPAAGKVSPVAAEESLYANRTTIKAGYYSSQEDGLDDGYIINVSWMRFINKLFALEFEAGYLDADGSESGVDLDLWAVPLMVNGRLNVPIWILEGYGGLGVGGFYYDAEASGAASADEDGFVFGGNAFIGASINLADAVSLGLEAKYYVTDDISDLDSSLDAYAVMLTLGFSR